MNGVFDLLINCYFQVKDFEVSCNLLVNFDYIQLCVGSDEE